MDLVCCSERTRTSSRGLDLFCCAERARTSSRWQKNNFPEQQGPGSRTKFASNEEAPESGHPRPEATRACRAAAPRAQAASTAATITKVAPQVQAIPVTRIMTMVANQRHSSMASLNMELAGAAPSTAAWTPSVSSVCHPSPRLPP